jgi:hypothetical protein
MQLRPRNRVGANVIILRAKHLSPRIATRGLGDINYLRFNKAVGRIALKYG